MKNAYRVSTEQHGNMKSIQKLNILQARCDSTLFCSNMWKTNYSHRHVNLIALHVFVAATVKLQILDTSEPDFSPLKQGSNWQHQLGLACLYLWHIIMSALRLPLAKNI